MTLAHPLEKLQVHLAFDAVEDRWHQPMMEICPLVEIERGLVLEARIYDIGPCLFSMPDHVIDDKAGFLSVRDFRKFGLQTFEISFPALCHLQRCDKYDHASVVSLGKLQVQFPDQLFLQSEFLDLGG